MIYGNKEYYELSDVIFGLRYKYQKMEAKLQELKQYAELNDEYDKLHFNLRKDNFYYDYYIKNMCCGSPVQKDEKGYCSDSVLEIVDSDNFNALASDILAEGFDDGIEFSTTFRNRFNNKEIIDLSTHFGSIHIYLKNVFRLRKAIDLHYFAEQDIISVSKNRGILTKNDVYDLLSKQVPGTNLSTYHIDLIDSFTSGKDVELIMNNGFSSSSDFNIIETSDTFVLKKKLIRDV